MRLKSFLLFFLFTLLFLFYPGDSGYFQIFAYNRRLFLPSNKKLNIKLAPIPVVKQSSPPLLSSSAAYVVDLISFTPIFEVNVRQRLFPASTTKIITALVALDIFEPDDIITVTRAFGEGQLMELKVGERITLENLLYGILVQSGNDAAYAIADAYGYDNFVKRMNEKAQELSMKDSFFTNPAGLDDVSQHTTAFDLALASRALLQNKLLRKIVATKEIVIADVDFQTFHKLSNVNKLLGEIQGIGGLKTGYTEFAGENLVSFYKNNDHQYIIVILKSQDRFEDTKNTVNWIQQNVTFINPNEK